jgi:bacteriorhodopsin
MVMEKREVDTRKKERKIWFLICSISGIVFIGIMGAAVYDIRFKYGFYMAALAYVIMFISFVMYAFIQYVSTKEMVSILAGKIRGIFD